MAATEVMLSRIVYGVEYPETRVLGCIGHGGFMDKLLSFRCRLSFKCSSCAAVSRKIVCAHTKGVPSLVT